MSRSSGLSVGLGGLALVLFAMGWWSGPAALTWEDQWSALRDGNGMAGTILWKLRLPRILLSALSEVPSPWRGSSMQAYFKNPLAGPSVWG